VTRRYAGAVLERPHAAARVSADDNIRRCFRLAVFATVFRQDLKTSKLSAVESVRRQEGVRGQVRALPQDEKYISLLPHPHVFHELE